MDQGGPGSQHFEPLLPSVVGSSMAMYPPVSQNDPSALNDPPPPTTQQRNFGYGDADGDRDDYAYRFGNGPGSRDRDGNVDHGIGFMPSYNYVASKAADACEKPDDYSLKDRRSPATDSNYVSKVHVVSEQALTPEQNGKSKEELLPLGSVPITAIDFAMKRITDKLFHVLEGMGGRLLQLETSVQQLERCIQGLQVSGGERHDETHLRLTTLEHLVREVQTGVQSLHDKKDAAEADSQSIKLQVAGNRVHAGAMQDGWRQSMDYHVVSSQPPPSQVPLHLSASQLPAQPPPPPHQQSPQVISNELASAANQQPAPLPPHHVTSPPNQAPSQVSPYYTLEPSSLSPSMYNQPLQPPQIPSAGGYNHPLVQASSYRVQPQLQYHGPVPSALSTSSEIPQVYDEQQSLPLSPHTPQVHTPSGSQQFFEPPVDQPGPTLLPPYMHQQAPQHPQSLPYAYKAPSDMYARPPYRVPSPLPSGFRSGVGSSFSPRLPGMSQPLPHALPAGGGPSGVTPASTKKPSMDQVIDEVVAMGFPREHALAVVRRLLELGESVDLNAVLDKLMNGREFQPPRRWVG